MTAELTYTPSNPSDGDALTFTVTGVVPDGSKIKVTSDGDELQASPPFGQEDQPEGTGSDRFNLTITGGTVGTFTLGVYQYGDSPAVTAPIYYYNDAPTYHYPDSSSVVSALEAALPGLEVTTERTGATLKVILGGKYSGKDMQMTVDTTNIGGSETASVTDQVTPGGPFNWGPIVLPANVYTADVVDSDDSSILSAPVTVTVT